MSDTVNFDAHLAALEAITEEQLKAPNMPIDIFIQEAETLYQWSQGDRAAMESIGAEVWVDALPVRLDILREAESRWQMQFQTRDEASAQWAEESPKAYALRDDLLRSFRYAFRHDEELLKRVAMITDGDSHADMIQDLSSLAVLGRQKAEPLAAMNFDMTQLDHAAELADAMGILLGRATGEKMVGNNGRVLRDQAFSYLKQAVDEVRASGKYLFHGNAARQKGYMSAFNSERARNARNSKAPEVEPSA